MSRVHRCDTCGKEEAWGPSWQWFGSYRDLDDGNPIFKACSQACMDKREETLELKRIASNLEAAKSDEQRLEDELRRKRAWRMQTEAALAKRQQEESNP